MFLEFLNGLFFEGQKVEVDAILLLFASVHPNIIIVTMSQRRSKKLNIWEYAFSWSFIGTCVTLNSPFDFVRFRLQVMPILFEQGHLFSMYKGCFDCARRVWKNEGWRAFFKGNLSNMIRMVPSETLVWKVKEVFQRNLHYGSNLSEAEHVSYNTAIGITSSLIVSLSLYPFEYIRQLVLNRTDRRGRGIWHYVKKTVLNEGVTGMYKGASIFSLGLVLFRGAYFGIYDSLKVKTKDQRLRWLASFLATYVSIFISYPIDTVRRRLVTSRGQYANSRACLRDVWVREGMRGLYLGWPMIFFQSLNASTMFFCYDRLVTNYEEAFD
jgi:solute carrier family 25 (mitochondrial adenine nucleotide translocator), member 4/5/6/31